MWVANKHISLETLGFHLCFYKNPLHQTTERGNGGGGGRGGGGGKSVRLEKHGRKLIAIFKGAHCIAT